MCSRALLKFEMTRCYEGVTRCTKVLQDVVSKEKTLNVMSGEIISCLIACF